MLINAPERKRETKISIYSRHPMWQLSGTHWHCLGGVVPGAWLWGAGRACVPVCVWQTTPYVWLWPAGWHHHGSAPLPAADRLRATLATFPAPSHVVQQLPDQPAQVRLPQGAGPRGDQQGGLQRQVVRQRRGEKRGYGFSGGARRVWVGWCASFSVTSHYGATLR